MPHAAHDRHLAVDGLRIRYRTAGSGEPLVLVHGFVAGMEASWIATGAFAALADDYRVAALDLRGHGESSRPAEPACYGMEMVLDIVRLMDHLAMERAHVVGFSMGGELALKLLEVAPHRLLSLTLAGAGWMRPGDFRHRGWQDGAALLAGLSPGRSIAARVWPDDAQPPPLELRDLFDGSCPTALAAVSRGMLEVTVPEHVLRDTAVPALLVFGEHDWIRPAAEEMVEVMPALREHVVPGHDHDGLVGSPALVRVVREFLASEAVRERAEAVLVGAATG